MPLPAAVQVFSVQASEFLAGIDKMLAATDRLAASLDLAAAAAERLSGIADAAAGADGRLAAAEEAAEARAVYLADAMDRVVTGLDASAAASGRAMAAADGLAASYDRAGASATVAGDRAATAGKKTSAFGGMMKTALLGVGIAAVYGIDKAMKFQASMEQLHTQAGVAQSKLAGLSQGVLQLAAQTGEGPQSLAESLYHVASNMASLGATGPKMMSAVRIAAEGAQVGGAGLVDVTNALTAAIASGIPGVQNFQQAMGMLNATVGSGDMHMQDLADAFSTGLLAVVKGYGISLKDTGAALAVFGDNNIRGAKAGTDFRMAVQALAVPAAAAKKELAGLGLTQTSLAKDMQSGGLMKALDDLTGKFRKNGVTARNEGEVITTLFGKKAGSGIAVLLEQMDRLKSKYPAITDAANGFGNAWQARQKTMAQQWNDLRAGLGALAISFGTILLPAATKVVGVIARFAGALEKNPVLAAFAGAVVALAVAMGIAATATAAFDAVLAVNPVIAIIMAVIALAAGLYELYKHFKIVRDVVADVGKFFAGAWRLAVEAAGAVITWFVNGPLAFIKQEIGVFAQWWHQNSAQIEEVTRVVWTVIKDIITVYWKILSTEIRIGLDVLKALWKASWTIYAATLKYLWDIMTTQIRVAIRLILDVISVVLDILTGKWGKAWSDLKRLASDALHGVVSVILSYTAGFGRLLWNAGAAIIQGLVGGLKSAWHDVTGFVGGIGSWISSHKGPIEADRLLLVPHGQAIMGGLVSGLAAGKAGLNATLARISADITNGMRLGLNETAAQVYAAAGRLAGEVTAAFGAGRITGRQENSLLARITAALAARNLSLAKIAATINYAKLGADITARIGAGMLETLPQAERAARQLMDAVRRELRHGQISTAQAARLTIRIEEDLARRKEKLARVMAGIGLKMAAGLLTSLEGATSASQVKSAVNKMIGYVRQAWAAGDITTARASSMTKWLEADSARLQSLAARRQSLAKTIAAANAYAAATSQNTQQWAGLGSVAGSMTSGGMVYSGNLLAGMQANLAKIRQFGAAVKKLGKLGLRKDLINQIIQMGPDQGLQVAEALISGPAKVIAEMDATQKQIVSGSNALGQAAANAMFDSGKQAGKGFLSGLKAQEHQITAMMDRAAVSMVKTLRRELGMGGGGSGDSRGSVTVNVHGFIGSERELVAELYKAIQEEALRHNRRNGHNGLSLR